MNAINVDILDARRRIDLMEKQGVIRRHLMESKQIPEVKKMVVHQSRLPQVNTTCSTTITRGWLAYSKFLWCYL